MESRGKISYFLLTASALFCLSASPRSQESSYYYTCSYREGNYGTDILVSKIDLSAKEIVDSIAIPIRGELEFNKPIVFSRGIHHFYCVFTLDGLPAKNATISNETITNFAIINENLELIRTGILPGIQLLNFSYSPNDNIEIKFLKKQAQNWHKRKAILSLENNNSIHLGNETEDPWVEENYPVISGFRFFKRIENQNDRLYWDVMPEGTYLLSLNIENNSLLDSLNIESTVDYFYLFGLSQNDSVTYVFYMNSNVVGGPENSRKLTIDPSYVKLFDSFTFNQLDSIPIIYPPLDSGYVMGSTGPIDRVGDYLVFFDLTGEDYRYFAPAMLFIFDTRTNEASWLRVGWR